MSLSANKIICSYSLTTQGKSRAFPWEGTLGAGSDRWAIARPPAEREALNLVLDVLAQLLEDAFDVLGRAVIGECP